MPWKFERFTEHAREALGCAQEEAYRLNHSYIDTEHLLFGLLQQRDARAVTVLSNLGVDVAGLLSTVQRTFRQGDAAGAGDPGLTAPARKVVDEAVKEARRLKHHYIGSEHLLLGLLRENRGIAAGLLRDMGVTLDRGRAETIRVLS